jgi:hypothetical protein
VLTYEPGRPLVFNHVPKAAGTALREALVAAVRPERVALGFDGSVFGSFDGAAGASRRLQRLVYNDPTDIPIDAEFVTGHIAPSTTRARFPDAPHLTVLREPRARLVSFWLYTRSRPTNRRRMWGALGDTFLLAKGPLDEFLAADVMAPGSDNFITRFLLWPHPLIPADGFIDPKHDETLLAEAMDSLNQFGHVGVVEDRALASGVGDFLGTELTMPVRNEGVALTESDRELVGDEVARASTVLERCTRLDAALWSAVVAQRMPDQDPQAFADKTLHASVERYAHAPLLKPMTAVDAGRVLARRVRRRVVRQLRG